MNDQEMAGTGVRLGLPPTQRLERGPASSRGVRVRPAGISLLQLAQVRRPQSSAIDVRARRQISPAAARQQYQCDRYPPPQWPTMGSRRTQEPGARLARYDATDRATRDQL